MTRAGFGRLTDPPVTMLLAGVRTVDPSDGTDGVRDIGIVDGRIADPGAVPAEAPRIDGHRLVAAPGFCDIHTHLREPGDPAAETIASGSRAAAHGGFTTLCAMPNTDPPLDSAEAVARVGHASLDVSCRSAPSVLIVMRFGVVPLTSYSWPVMVSPLRNQITCWPVLSRFQSALLNVSPVESSSARDSPNFITLSWLSTCCRPSV